MAGISINLSINYGSVFTIIHDKLAYRKMSTTWTSCGLTPEMKEKCVSVREMDLQVSEEEGHIYVF